MLKRRCIVNACIHIELIRPFMLDFKLACEGHSVAIHAGFRRFIQHCVVNLTGRAGVRQFAEARQQVNVAFTVHMCQGQCVLLI